MCSHIVINGPLPYHIPNVETHTTHTESPRPQDTQWWKNPNSVSPISFDRGITIKLYGCRQSDGKGCILYLEIERESKRDSVAVVSATFAATKAKNNNKIWILADGGPSVCVRFFFFFFEFYLCAKSS